ncbi:MAG: MFS transporter [Bacteroidales bacterium]|nr:MFS transporter [Bacteroidales bacterium]MCF8386400.1 MFS transporter [Bacteroidales bacterium]MCF8397890.1 MFS transporter [Bacteroidales bacterium]
MKNQTSLKYFLPVMVSFYVMGFVDVVGVATGFLKQDFELPNSLAQLLPFGVFIWFLLASIPTGMFQDRKGTRLTVNIGMIVTGIGVLIPFVYYSLATAIIGFAVLGIGNTILQVSANPLLIGISPENSKAANLSLSQFIKAIASMLGPIIAASLAIYTGDWKLIFPIYAVISFLAAAWLASVKIEEPRSVKPPATLKSVFALLKNPFILIAVIGIFFMVGFDVTMNTNIALFLKNRFSLSIETASFGISIYFVSLMIGRFLGAILLRKINNSLFMVISTIITLIGLAGILLSKDLMLTRVMIFVAGFGFSNLFPLMFALIVARKPDYANELSGLIILAVCGGAIVPPIAGVLTDLAGISASIFVLLFCTLYVAFATYYVVKK